MMDPIGAVIRTIQKGRCRKIITVGGSGMSTAAGIPDIRSEGLGRYEELGKFDFVEEVLDIDTYKKNPRAFLIVARDIFPGYRKPTLCHYLVTLLAEKGFLLRHYTYNIDSLESAAGLSGEFMVQAHGSFSSSHCMRCTKAYPPWWFRQYVLEAEVPKCLMCTHLVKPDIVFHGEALPKEFHKRCASDLRKATFLLALGTSFSVQPFISLIRKTRQGCTRLMIKKTELESLEKLKVDILKDIKNGPAFNPSEVPRDVMWQMECDEGCWQLADRLGWGAELIRLMEETNKKLDEKIRKTKEEDADPRYRASFPKKEEVKEESPRGLIHRLRYD